MRRDVDDRLHEERTASRDLLEVPSVLHRQAEACRLRRPYRSFHAAVREKGSEEVTQRGILTPSAARRKDLVNRDASPSEPALSERRRREPNGRLSMTRRFRSAWLASARLIVGTFNA